MKYDYLKLAEVLKERREELEISTRDLAYQVGVSHTEISRIENGMRPHFSFVILAKLCKALKIDMINLIDLINLWEVDDNKVFYVMFKQEEEKIYKVHARSEGEAIRIAFGFVEDNNLIDFSKSKKDLLIGAVENIEDFNKEIIDTFDRTGQLVEGSDEKIIIDVFKEKVKKEDENIDEEIEDDDEIEGVICPEDCIYYCPNCGNCIKRD